MGAATSSNQPILCKNPGVQGNGVGAATSGNQPILCQNPCVQGNGVGAAISGNQPILCKNPGVQGNGVGEATGGNQPILCKNPGVQGNGVGEATSSKQQPAYSLPKSLRFSTITFRTRHCLGKNRQKIDPKSIRNRSFLMGFTESLVNFWWIS